MLRRSQRALAGLVGILGGILILLGAAVALLTGLAASRGTGTEGIASALIVALLLGILGLVALWLSRPRLFWWSGRKAVNGVLLIGIGAIAWLAIGGNLLILVGSALLVLAGFVYLIESIFTGTGAWLRRLSRRW